MNYLLYDRMANIITTHRPTGGKHKPGAMGIWRLKLAFDEHAEGKPLRAALRDGFYGVLLIRLEQCYERSQSR